MRNSRNENISEHSHQTALIAHALACIEKQVFKTDVDPDKCAVYAIYHETAEVITGDLPTPIKYYNKEIKSAYKDIEREAENRLLEKLPDCLKEELKKCVQPNESIEKTLVKYADKISALIKCIEELSFNNREFDDAYNSTLKLLEEAELKSVKYFLDNFVEAYYLSLDELSRD